MTTAWTALCLWILLVLPTHAARPNFLFLFADDQRADTIAAWGNPHIHTPNLDRLSQEGFSFRANYCFGSNSGAVCVPSRAMLMTGRTWLRVDHPMTRAKMLPELLREHGYTTFATGKWHNEKPSFKRAFQSGKALFFGGMNDHTRTRVEDLDAQGQFVQERQAHTFSSELFASTAIEFLEQHPAGKPFFCYVAFTAPHDPRNPPEPYRQRYYQHPPPLPANFLPQLPFDNGILVQRDENLLPWPRPPKALQDQLCEYYGLITHLDEQVGRILHALSRSPHATKTIVIYAADHGLALGSHGLLGKQNVYEHSMRCPLILRGPGLPVGKSTTAFTYLLDLFPTLCELAGVPPPTGLDGVSLQPLWKATKIAVRDSVFLPFQNLMRAVRDDRWKLICYPQINHQELFDLYEDPFETKNLAELPVHAQQRERLLALMKTWQDKTGDTQSLTNAQPKPKAIDLSNQSRKPDQWQPQWIVEKYFQASP